MADYVDNSENVWRPNYCGYSTRPAQNELRVAPDRNTVKIGHRVRCVAFLENFYCVFRHPEIRWAKTRREFYVPFNNRRVRFSFLLTTLVAGRNPISIMVTLHKPGKIEKHQDTPS